jgi:hypothetical protein
MLKKVKPFNWRDNEKLVINQHIIERIFRKLRAKNGIQAYVVNPERRRKVVQHYMKKYHIKGTSVESYWVNHGACILIGKAY